MLINRLVLKNYRLFEELCVEFDPSYSVIVGKNSIGKSSVLEALAVSAGAFFLSLPGTAKHNFRGKSDARLKFIEVPDGTDVQRQWPVFLEADGVVQDQQVHWGRRLTANGGTSNKDAKALSELSARCQEALQSGDLGLVLPVIAYYSTGRLWDYHRQKKGSEDRRSTRLDGYTDCLDGTANLKLMMRWFRKTEVKRYQKGSRNHDGNGSQIAVLSAVYAAMERCIEAFSGKRDVRVLFDMDVQDLMICYREREGASDSGAEKRLPLSLMSDGYRTTISLVADIAYRMAVLNPQLGDDVLKRTHGLVLVDEVDLHLHPAWQQRVIHVLTDIFPAVQFIVTTHAPAVIHSVTREHLIILGERNVRTATSQTYGKDVNAVLGEIMGAERRPSEVMGLFDAFYHALDERRFSVAEDVLKRLEDCCDSRDAEIVSCHTKLRLTKLRVKP